MFRFILLLLLAIFNNKLYILVLFSSLKYSSVFANHGTENANAFVTFHVRNPTIVSNIDKFQRELLQLDPEFGHTFQPLDSLHVTILFINLNGKNAKNASRALGSTAQKWGQKLTVRFRSIGHNGNASMYAALEKMDMPKLTKLYELAVSEFGTRGIPSLNPFNATHYSAHMTILYLSKPSDQRLIKWWPGAEQKWHGKWLGKERVKTLQICNITMDEVIRDYKVLYEVNLIQ